MDPDRRTTPNRALTEAVDATVELMPHINRRQAALVMARDGVPQPVIRRILDEPAQRRAAERRRGDAGEDTFPTDRDKFPEK